MTRVMLIRHAACDPTGVSLAGRAPGVSLNQRGRREAARLAQRLARVRLDAVYASPLERALETAELLARGRPIDVQPLPEVVELEFGEWTGRPLHELDDDARWNRFNAYRSGTRSPGGESALDVQYRAVSAMERLRCRHPGARVAVVTHADVIRAIVAWYAAVPIDLAQRLDVAPASVSMIELGEWGPRLLCLNDTGWLDDPPSA